MHAYLHAIAALSCPGCYYRIAGNFCWSKEIFVVVLHAQFATIRIRFVLPPPFILEEFHCISIFSAGLTVIYVKICIYKIMKMFCCCIDLHRCCWDVLKQVCWNQWRRADQFHGESASHKWCLPCLLWLWVLGSRLITVSLPVRVYRLLWNAINRHELITSQVSWNIFQDSTSPPSHCKYN